MSRFGFAAIFATFAVLVLVAHGATAQSATGGITGRVIWGPCVRGIPLPMAPDAQAQPGAPEVQPAPLPGQRPVPAPVNGLPAGAVLVAVQNTSISARTDETGRFSLSGAPAGQYLTVAAGPVASESTAIAERPNVFLDGSGQSVDIGTLSLGGPSPLGIACRFVPGVGAAQGAETTPPPSPAEPAPPSEPGGTDNP